MDAVKALVLCGAQHRPLFLLVEDLHWVDPHSEAFLRALVESLASYPVLLVCTYRPGGTTAWQDCSFHQRLALNPLSSEATAAMVRTLLGVPHLGAVGREPRRRAGGRQPVLHRRADALSPRARAARAFHKPCGRGAGRGQRAGHRPSPFDRTIDRLPEPLKYTLQLASALGREFRLPLLEALVPLGADLPPISRSSSASSCSMRRSCFPR